MIPVFVSFAPIDVEVPNKTKYYLNFSQKQYTIRYNKWLSKQDKYVNHCSNIILELIKHDKKILVVAQLKELLEVIYSNTIKLLKDNDISEDRIKLIHGTSEYKFKELKEQINVPEIIFSTNKFFSEGLSINWLDTLIYLTPPSSSSLSSIPQLVGRIVRECEGKHFVNVIDIYNSSFNIECFRKIKREKLYKNFGYNVI